MSIGIATRIEGQKRVLSLTGRFDYSSHKDFRTTYEEMLADPNCKEIVLDMKQVEYVDSAALGMLLLLRDRARSTNKKVVISGCKGVALQVLEVANFHKLFEMV